MKKVSPTNRLFSKLKRIIWKDLEKQTRSCLSKVYNDCFIVKAPDGPFGDKRPCDFLVFGDHLIVAIECKTKSFVEGSICEEWDPKIVEQHQIDVLKYVESIGGLSRFIVGFYMIIPGTNKVGGSHKFIDYRILTVTDLEFMIKNKKKLKL
jgi:hypothetical protein